MYIAHILVLRGAQNKPGIGVAGTKNAIGNTPNIEDNFGVCSEG